MMRINAELRFEIITICCAAFGGAFLAAVVSWFSPWSAWTAEAAVFIGLLCGAIAVVFHLLVRELGKVTVERQNKRNAEMDLIQSNALMLDDNQIYEVYHAAQHEYVTMHHGISKNSLGLDRAVIERMRVSRNALGQVCDQIESIKSDWSLQGRADYKAARSQAEAERN